MLLSKLAKVELYEKLAEVIDALNNGYLSVTKIKYNGAGTYTVTFNSNGGKK